MEISVIGTGYVGLVTGVCLAEIGHHVTCIDVDKKKIKKLQRGLSPIYEPGLDELMKKNIRETRLAFTTRHQKGFSNKEIIYIAVGTPQQADGSVDLSFIFQAAKDIGQNIKNNVIVVTKSTVPTGTNEKIKKIILKHLSSPVHVEVVSNPEFLREGSAVKDFFFGDRIIIGYENEGAAQVLSEIYEPLDIPIFLTDIRSSEMIKYASNAFLATKISFINEIANMCEKTGADIGDVAYGMGLDQRIGRSFLQAGLGYGGACFPKDTQALVKFGESLKLDLKIIHSAIEVNREQQLVLVHKIKKKFHHLKGKKLALLGLTFKPETDDLRGAPSIRIARKLNKLGIKIIAYDPAGYEKAKELLPASIEYADSVENALNQADIALIITEWHQITESFLKKASQLMKQPVIFDGRNCFPPTDAEKIGVEYYSIGRPPVNKNKFKND